MKNAKNVRFIALLATITWFVFAFTGALVEDAAPVDTRYRLIVALVHLVGLMVMNVVIYVGEHLHERIDHIGLIIIQHDGAQASNIVDAINASRGEAY